MKESVCNLSVQVIAGLDHNTLPGSKEFRGAIRAFIASGN
jgi:hypothetical protein